MSNLKRSVPWIVVGVLVTGTLSAVASGLLGKVGDRTTPLTDAELASRSGGQGVNNLDCGYVQCQRTGCSATSTTCSAVGNKCMKQSFSDYQRCINIAPGKQCDEQQLTSKCAADDWGWKVYDCSYPNQCGMTSTPCGDNNWSCNAYYP
jgi:hypothetical protein